MASQCPSGYPKRVLGTPVKEVVFSSISVLLSVEFTDGLFEDQKVYKQSSKGISLSGRQGDWCLVGLC